MGGTQESIMTTTNLNPQLKAEMLATFKTALYQPTTSHLKKELFTLIQENSSLKRNNQNCFSFKGAIYEYGQIKGKYPRPLNLLDSSLRDRMKAYLKECSDVHHEQNLTVGYFQRLLLSTSNAADYFLLLPGALHGVIRKYERYLLDDESQFTEFQVTAFIQDNDKYVNAIKTRLTYNLLEVP